MNTQKQQKRRDQVLTNMYTHDKITKEEMTEAQKHLSLQDFARKRP